MLAESQNTAYKTTCTICTVLSTQLDLRQMSFNSNATLIYFIRIDFIMKLYALTKLSCSYRIKGIGEKVEKFSREKNSPLLTVSANGLHINQLLSPL